MHVVEPFKIKKSPIHNVKGSRLRQQLVQDIQVMQFASRNINKCEDIPVQIELFMHFIAAFMRWK